jgi:hypothetical protein
LEASQSGLAERLPKLIDLALDHAGVCFESDHLGHGTTQKQMQTRTILNSTIRLMELTQQPAMEGKTYDQTPDT